MADGIVGGLFGMQSPQQLQQEYYSGLMTPASQMGQMNLLNQLIATAGNAGAMMGYGGGRLLGGKVAGEVEAASVNDALQQVNKMGIKDPADKMAMLADLLSQNPATARQAMLAQQEAIKLKKQGYEMKGFEDAEKAKKAVADVLAKNPNATSQELYAAAAPFSSDPEAIIKVVAGKEDKAAAAAAKLAEERLKAQDKIEQLRLQGEQRLEVAKLNSQTRIDAATIAGASREQIALMQADARKEIAQMQLESREQMSQSMGQIRLQIARENNATKREIEAAKRNTGVLAPSLQKEEGSDLELIDNYEAMASVLDTPIKALTPNEKGVVSLQLDPASRALYAARNFAGKSTPESRAYADLQAAIAQAVNIKTDAAKGVQTDKDVLRFANALIEENARNDVKATFEALQKFQGAAKTAAEKTKVRVNSRRQAQNVGVYFTNVATPEGTAPSGKTSNAANYSDPDKERRYQEWKKKQGL